jgi:hypothetical protein
MEQLAAVGRRKEDRNKTTVRFHFRGGFIEEEERELDTILVNGISQTYLVTAVGEKNVAKGVAKEHPLPLERIEIVFD